MHERRAVHRTIIVLDVEKFGDSRRNNLDQLAVREGLYRSVGEAFQQAGVPWEAATLEDRGDGILILIPPEVPKSLLAELLPSALVAELTAHNSVHLDEQRIRLRMSLHAGEVFYDQYGVTGEAVNWAFRLVDARLLKAALAGSSGVLAIISSSWFFEQVILNSAADVRAAYRRVLVRAKDATKSGWICLPDAVKAATAGTSPYKGLRAFEKEDGDLFFGRESAVQELMSAVTVSGLVPVVGKSGAGKSSLVQAGLLPRLEKAGWAAETVLPRPDLPVALAAALARLSGAPPAVPRPVLQAWQDYLSRHGLTAAARKARRDREWERAVIVIDQFEEALGEEDTIDPVLRQLSDLPDGGLLTVVVTLRGDAFGRLLESQDSFGDRLRRNVIRLFGMDKHELAEAIRLPAEWYGLDVTDQLVERLTGAIHGKPGALPLLEFSLDQMWRALPPGKETLSLDEYHRIRGLNGALAAHADRVLDSMSPAEQAQVRKLFVNYLTSVDQPGVRQVVRRSDCAPGYWPVIVRLANERLLTVGSDEQGHETAEVVHEALLRAWNQLQVWLTSEEPFRRWRQRLREDMRRWLETGDSSELLTGSPLTDARRWKDDRGADLDVDELRFITASVSRQDEQDEQYRTVSGRARARELTHQAESERDARQALRYAIEVIEFSPDPAADRLVRACLDRLEIAELLPVSRRRALEAASRFRQRLTLAEWSHGPGPDGRWLIGDPDTGLVIGDDGVACYRAGGATVMPGPVVAAGCTRSGVACLVTETGRLAMWQLAGDADQAEKLGERNIGVPAACVAVSDTANLVAVARRDRNSGGKIRVLEGKSLSEVAALPLDGFVRDIDVSADHKVAALGHDRRLRVWDPVTGDLLCESVRSLKGAGRIAFAQHWVMAGDVATGASGRFPVHPDRLKEQAAQALTES